jgi:Holliday junction resolvasome RuvABC DNA-binding subunit
LSVRADGTPDQIAPVLIDEDAALVAASAAIGEKAAAKLVASVRAGA